SYLNLHSFPTRRSSDLVWCRRKYKGFNIGVEFLESTCPFQVKMILQVCQIKDFIEHKERQELVGNCTTKDSFKKNNDDALSWIRSEEHTSELQSRENLV